MKFLKMLFSPLFIKKYKWKAIDENQMAVNGVIRFSGRYDAVAIKKAICDTFTQRTGEDLLIVDIIGAGC